MDSSGWCTLSQGVNSIFCLHDDTFFSRVWDLVGAQAKTRKKTKEVRRLGLGMEKNHCSTFQPYFPNPTGSHGGLKGTERKLHGALAMRERRAGEGKNRRDKFKFNFPQAIERHLTTSKILWIPQDFPIYLHDQIDLFSISSLFGVTGELNIAEILDFLTFPTPHKHWGIVFVDVPFIDHCIILRDICT